MGHLCVVYDTIITVFVFVFVFVYLCCMLYERSQIMGLVIGHGTHLFAVFDIV